MYVQRTLEAFTIILTGTQLLCAGVERQHVRLPPRIQQREPPAIRVVAEPLDLRQTGLDLRDGVLRGTQLENLAPQRLELQGHVVQGIADLVRDITQSRRETEEAIESEKLSALTLLAAGVALKAQAHARAEAMAGGGHDG